MRPACFFSSNNAYLSILNTVNSQQIPPPTGGGATGGSGGDDNQSNSSTNNMNPMQNNNSGLPNLGNPNANTLGQQNPLNSQGK